jgi:hypothetical protein
MLLPRANILHLTLKGGLFLIKLNKYMLMPAPCRPWAEIAKETEFLSPELLFRVQCEAQG